MCWNEGEREGIPTNVTFYTCVPVQLCGLLTRSVNVDDLMPAAKSATQLETNLSRPKPVERERECVYAVVYVCVCERERLREMN